MNMTQYEREEQQIVDDFNNGLIDLKEYNRRLRELEQDERDSIRAAYEQELEELNDKYFGRHW